MTSFGRVPLESLRTAVPGCNAAIPIEHDNRVVPDAIDQTLELLGPLALRSLPSLVDDDDVA